MKRFALLFGALAIGLSDGAQAQRPQPAQSQRSETRIVDVVGTWTGAFFDSTGTRVSSLLMMGSKGSMGLSVWPDSTFQMVWDIEGGQPWPMAIERWRRRDKNIELLSARFGELGLTLDGPRLTLVFPEGVRLVFTRVASQPSFDPGFPTRVTGRPRPCRRGKIERFACQNVELLSYLPKPALGNSTGYDLWGWRDSATDREFILIGGKATAFVEVTDPVNPKYLGVLPPHAGAGSLAAQSVKVYQHYAFIGYEGGPHGLQVFDLAQLRDVKSPTTFTETAYYDGVTRTHTLTLNPESGFAYVNGDVCLHMVDVRTPTRPTFAGCYTEGNSVHDSQCVIYRGPDQRYRGREICVTYSGSNGLRIADVTDKQYPKTISSATYPNVAYTHQGWFTDDQRYLFLDDEFDESIVGRTRTIGFDLSKLDDPVVVVEFFNEKTTETDHNLYIRGRYMYQGNYNAGLRVIDIDDPKHPKEVGYLTDMGWAWGTYPFLKNDVVAVSAGFGLFLVRLQKQ